MAKAKEQVPYDTRNLRCKKCHSLIACPDKVGCKSCDPMRKKVYCGMPQSVDPYKAIYDSMRLVENLAKILQAEIDSGEVNAKELYIKARDFSTALKNVVYQYLKISEKHSSAFEKLTREEQFFLLASWFETLSRDAKEKLLQQLNEVYNDA